MRTARAAVFPAPDRPVELRDLPLPDLAAGEALLAVECSEVCGTDVHLHHGLLAGVPYPLIPGHVTAGRLAQIRGELRDVDGVPLREGDAVTFLDVHRTCHRCWYCLVAKASTRCPERKVYGITYGAADGLCGGWASHLHLKAGTRVIRLGGTSARDFLVAGCSLPTALHALDRARIGIGDIVLVLGTGPVGLAAAALARAAGAATVLAIGGPAARLPAAHGMGVDAVLDFTALPPAERAAWVRERSGGRGADVVIEATGAPDAVVQAMRCARDAGRVVVVGQYTDHGGAEFNPHLDLNKKHLEVLGCWGSDYSHFHRAVQVAGHARLGAPWRALPVREFALADVAAALDLVARGEVVKALVRP
ncbi:MAG: zinc-binding dehydrogenase [Planctomycetes bacterium]|nr:zinc-binding dehydrogenase [Planctomycetota bacterium]